MTSIVKIDIRAPRERVAELLADPQNNTKWMDDVERYEPISGRPGTPGSTYRLVPKTGNMVFVATIVARDPPNELRLRLDASNVVVSITDRLVPTSSQKTRLVSREEFRFKGPIRKLFGFFAQGQIRKAHRRHMEAFKRFAES